MVNKSEDKRMIPRHFTWAEYLLRWQRCGIVGERQKWVWQDFSRMWTCLLLSSIMLFLEKLHRCQGRWGNVKEVSEWKTSSVDIWKLYLEKKFLNLGFGSGYTQIPCLILPEVCVCVFLGERVHRFLSDPGVCLWSPNNYELVVWKKGKA